MIDIRDGELADAIVGLVDELNRPAPFPPHLAFVQEPDPRQAERKKKELSELYRLCAGKKVTLVVDGGSYLRLVKFLASCADLEVELHHTQVVVTTKSGEVVMK